MTLAHHSSLVIWFWSRRVRRRVSLERPERVRSKVTRAIALVLFLSSDRKSSTTHMFKAHTQAESGVTPRSNTQTNICIPKILPKPDFTPTKSEES